LSNTNAEFEDNYSINIIQNIYPNPTIINYINLSLNYTNLSKHNIKIYNLLGKEILNYEYTPKTLGIENIQLDISNLDNGIYILKADNSIKSESTKLIIAK